MLLAKRIRSCQIDKIFLYQLSCTDAAKTYVSWQLFGSYLTAFTSSTHTSTQPEDDRTFFNYDNEYENCPFDGSGQVVACSDGTFRNETSSPSA